MSSATCCLVASVEYTITAHQPTFSTRSQAGARILRSTRSSHRPLSTEKATCSDGQALPEASADFRKATDGYRAQSISGCGTAVGQNRKIAKPTRLRTVTALTYGSSSRRVPSSIGTSETYSHKLA